MASLSGRTGVLLGLVIGLLIGACGVALLRRSPQQSTEIKERTYALNVVNSSIPAWQPALSNLKKFAMATPGMKVVYGGPADGDASKQIEEIDQLITNSVSGIILCPADSKTLIPSVDKAHAKGIPCITLFSDVNSANRLLFISADERRSGYNIAASIARLNKWNSDGKESIEVMAIMTKPGLSFADERLAGLKDACNEFQSLKLVEVVSNEWSERRGAELVGATLVKHPKLKAIFGLDSRAAVGAVTALRERNIPKGSVVVTGWDADRDTLESISSGWVSATSAPNITLMTRTAATVLESHTLDYLYPEGFSFRQFKVNPLPSSLHIPQSIIDGSNVGAFMPPPPH